MIDNLDTACQFGGALQYQAARVQAELAILRRPSAWVEGPAYEDYQFPWKFGGLPQAILDAATARYLAETNVVQETLTTVESIRYSNPIEIVLGAAMLTAVVVLRTVRDWPSRRRLNDAVADDARNIVLARKELRDALVRNVIDGNIPIGSQQIEELLTLDVTRALTALGDSQITLQELEGTDKSNS
ncbi:hypothetical protein [Mycobacterium paraterrae]|uniref:Uncharacterized protein n=1 Tax=Mycobacterium paraterrae TaxID=577492 RepID=A0ABY3VL45_9MYCO|nr:hypothetical protein [Mycobacterium paraterrae]UMB70135.1 hypothetical protein MKK62_01970 [Mycobacterium paraterrae]